MALEIHARYETNAVRLNHEQTGGHQITATTNHYGICGFADNDFEINIGSNELDDMKQLRDDLDAMITAVENGDVSDDGVYLWGEKADGSVRSDE